MNNLTKEDLITSLRPGKCDLIGVMGRHALHVFDRLHRSWVYSSEDLGYETLFEEIASEGGSGSDSGEESSAIEDGEETPSTPYSD